MAQMTLIITVVGFSPPYPPPTSLPTPTASLSPTFLHPTLSTPTAVPGAAGSEGGSDGVSPAAAQGQGVPGLHSHHRAGERGPARPHTAPPRGSALQVHPTPLSTGTQQRCLGDPQPSHDTRGYNSADTSDSYLKSLLFRQSHSSITALRSTKLVGQNIDWKLNVQWIMVCVCVQVPASV